MSATQKGGPAFPIETRHPASEGMNLRDWFAGQVLAGYAASDRAMTAFAQEDSIDGHLYGGSVAEACYTIADAMLAERTK